MTKPKDPLTEANEIISLAVNLMKAQPRVACAAGLKVDVIGVESDDPGYLYVNLADGTSIRLVLSRIVTAERATKWDR